MMTAIRRMIEPLQRRVMLMISRCVITAVDDTKKMQELQISLLDGETAGAAERMQMYGFSSKPLASAEGIAVSVGGNRDHVVVIAADDRRYRVKNLASGEVVVYNNTGASVTLKADGSIEAVPAGSGTVKLGGTALLRKLIDSRFVALYNAHVHPDPVSGVSGPPSVPISEATAATAKTEAL
jgi:phage baseplate assembly protein V